MVRTSKNPDSYHLIFNQCLLCLVISTALFGECQTDVPAPIMNGLCNIPALNPCVVEARCTTTVPVVGDTICICPKGYGGDGMLPSQGGSGCQDIDECLSGLHNCDLTQYCANIVGGFECKCIEGFQPAPDGKACVDINECELDHMNSCRGDSVECENTIGSYMCKCINDTMTFDTMEGVCRDTNECEDQGGILNACNQLCINEDPGYSCGCYPGYELSEDFQTCTDIDECLDPLLHGCDDFSGTSKCVNLAGSFTCECNRDMGYQDSGDGRTCINLNECTEFADICGSMDACCLDLEPPQRFSCMIPKKTGLFGIGSVSGQDQLQMGGVNDAMFRSANYSLGQNVVAGGSGIGNFLGGGSSTGNFFGELMGVQKAPPPPTTFPGRNMSYSQPMNSNNQYGNIDFGNQSSLVTTENYAARSNQQAQTYRNQVNNHPRTPMRVSSNTSTLRECFEIKTDYSGDEGYLRNLLGVFDPIKCQLACLNDDKCRFFSVDIKKGICGLKTMRTEPKTKETMVSGPKICPEGTLRTSPNKIRTSVFSPNSLGGLGEFFVRRLVDDEVEEDARVLEVCDSTEEYDCFIANGDIPLPSSHETLINDEEGINEIFEDVDAQTLDGKANKPSGHRKLAFGLIGGPGKILQKPATLLSGLKGGTCPPGYVLGADVYRKQLKDQTVRTIKHVIVPTQVNPDGTQSRVSPEQLTNAVVRNTDMAAREFGRWYSELSAVPSEMASVAKGTGLAGVIPGMGGMPGGISAPGMMAPGGPTIPGVPPPAGIPAAQATVGAAGAAAAVGGAALASGLVVGGVTKAKYAGGPGNSLYMDRSGKSRAMLF